MSKMFSDNIMIEDILTASEIEITDTMQVCGGWVGRQFPEIIDKTIGKPSPDQEDITCWEPYFIEGRKLSSSDQLLYIKNGEYGIFNFDYLITDKEKNIGLISIEDYLFIDYKKLKFYPSSKSVYVNKNDDIYYILRNITFNSYSVASNRIKRAYRNYAKSGGASSRCVLSGCATEAAAAEVLSSK